MSVRKRVTALKNALVPPKAERRLAGKATTWGATLTGLASAITPEAGKYGAMATGAAHIVPWALGVKDRYKANMRNESYLIALQKKIYELKKGIK